MMCMNKCTQRKVILTITVHKIILYSKTHPIIRSMRFLKLCLGFNHKHTHLLVSD